MSLDTLQERLAQLQDTTSQLKDLIDRLANLRFQPGSAPLDASVTSLDDDDDDAAAAAAAAALSSSDSDSKNVAAELAAEIAQALRDEEDDLEILREEVLDVRVGPAVAGAAKRLSSSASGAGPTGIAGAGVSEAEKAKGRLKEGVRRLEGELKLCRILFRKAQLSARTSLQQAQKQERALLIASYAHPPRSSAATTTGTGTPAADDSRSGASSPAPSSRRPHHHRKHHHHRGDHEPPPSAESSASASVTAALRQMHALAATEVARSDFAQQALADSTAALTELGDRYGALGGALQASRALAAKLLGGARSDTWYLEAALWVVCATAAWLVFRRLLYGPLWLLVWWPVRTGWRVLGGAVGMVGSGSGSGSGPSMVVVDGGEAGRSRVVGMTGGTVDVPTASVGGSSSSGSSSSAREGRGRDETIADGQEDESMVEQVGRVVDGDVDPSEQHADTQGDVGGGDAAEAKNPKKRMWEEDKEAAKKAAREAGEKVKDEL